MAIECKTALERLLEADPAELGGEGDSELVVHLRGCERCTAVAERLLDGQQELAAELGELELEVSVLSPSRKVPGPEAIRVGKHGVVLSKGGRRAVFLPQVAPEQGWDRDTMLDHLAQKAGLPSDGWRSGARFEVFTAQVFSEER